MSGTDRFWDMFSKSMIVSGALAMAVWGAIIYLAIAQIPVPDGLMAGGSLILGFFFGARSGQQTERIQAQNQLMRDRLMEVT